MKKFLISVLLLAGIADGSNFNVDLNTLTIETFRKSQVKTSAEDLEEIKTNINNGESTLVDQDAFLTVPTLIKKYGYPVEVHQAQTPDGYLLELHRIPQPGAQPVYLHHGLLDSSAGWVIMGPNVSLGYILHDLGYDVWLGNSRGNRYSRNHIYLSPNKKEFWDFSFHEIGTYDLPTNLDYILSNTEYKKAHFIGHSQGTTSFWIMCSQRPGYCDKILSMNALAPVAFMKNLKSPVVRLMVLFMDQLDLLLKLIGAYEFLPSSDFLQLVGQVFCKEEAISQVLCSNVLFLMAGYNSELLNSTMLPVILGHTPAGAATKQLVHYGQLVQSGDFGLYDYGLLKNVLKYGTFKPPTYDLKKVTAPVFLHYSLNDWLADPKDVAKLESKLPNLVKSRQVPPPKFNHLDFIWGIGVNELLYEQVVKELKTFDSL